MANTIMWFRRDLRVADNRALVDAIRAARDADGAVIPSSDMAGDAIRWALNIGKHDVPGRYWTTTSCRILTTTISFDGRRGAAEIDDRREERIDAAQAGDRSIAFRNALNDDAVLGHIAGAGKLKTACFGSLVATRRAERKGAGDDAQNSFNSIGKFHGRLFPPRRATH